MNLRKGSYTIEASLTVPILLFAMAIGMLLAIDLYQETLKTDEYYLVEDIWAVESFYRDDLVGGIIKNEY